YITPAYIYENTSAATASAQGQGLGANGVATPGLSAQVLGGAANIYGSQAYGDGVGDTLFALFMTFVLGAPPGPQHLVFTLGSDFTYVLPNGFNVTLASPPAITGIFPNADGTIAILGGNFA